MKRITIISAIKFLTIIFIMISKKSNAQTFELNGNMEKVEILKPEEFNLFDTWEIVYREWCEDCKKPIKKGELIFDGRPITNFDLHLGEQIKFTPISVYSNSNIVDFNLPFTKYRINGYWSIQEHQNFELAQECLGNYFKDKFGNKQLVVEIGCGDNTQPFIIDTVKSIYTPSYTIPNNFNSQKIYVINRDLMILPDNGELTYFKRTNKMFEIPKDENGMRYIIGNFRNGTKDIRLDELTDQNKYTFKINLSNNIDPKNAKAFFYQDYYCKDFKEVNTPFPTIVKEIRKDNYYFVNNTYYFELPKTQIPLFYVSFSMKNRQIKDPTDKWEIKYDTYKIHNAIIKNNKAFLYNLPKKETKLKTYLIKNDNVTILDKEGIFYLIHYEASKTIAWIKKSDIE